MVRLTPFYYSFASAAADFDRDGNMDVVSGPFIFFGPEFTKKREIYLALATQPGVSFSSNWLEFAGDFTGDGWPDVLLASTSGTILYVNPKGEPRRWDAFKNVIPPGPSVAEVTVMKDIDGDGKADLVYMGGGALRWAQAGSDEPHRSMALDASRRAGHLRRARHRRRRHQRRRQARHPQRLWMVGKPRQGRHADVEVPPAGLRPLERTRRPGRRGDVRLRRQRRRPQRRRDVAPGARVRARVVRAEARRRAQRHLRAAHDFGRLRVEERRQRDLLGAARQHLRGHGRRRGP